MKLNTELIMIFISLFGMFLTILFTLVGAVWYLATKFNQYVTHSVCESRREHCPCRKDVDRLMKSDNKQE